MGLISVACQLAFPHVVKCQYDRAKFDAGTSKASLTLSTTVNFGGLPPRLAAAPWTVLVMNQSNTHTGRHCSSIKTTAEILMEKVCFVLSKQSAP